jgi:hypothetical protein
VVLCALIGIKTVFTVVQPLKPRHVDSPPQVIYVDPYNLSAHTFGEPREAGK